MTSATLEHVNVTVTNPIKTAERLCQLFGWHIRWQGEALNLGYTVHVGTDDSYVAVYSRPTPATETVNSNATRGGLNHIGIIVEDLDDVEAKVIDAGYKPVNHADYEPGRRFYFHDDDDIEFEVVSYTTRNGAATS